MGRKARIFNSLLLNNSPPLPMELMTSHQLGSVLGKLVSTFLSKQDAHMSTTLACYWEGNRSACIKKNRTRCRRTRSDNMTWGGGCGLKEGNTNLLILQGTSGMWRGKDRPPVEVRRLNLPLPPKRRESRKSKALSKHTFLFNFSHVEKPLVS